MLDLSNALIIANPAAAGGRVGRSWDRILPQIRDVLGDVPVWRTEHRGHARILAREALWQNKNVLLSLGGDGTHSEVVSGVVRDRPRPGTITVGVLPIGTGGDFRRMIEGSGNLREQAERILTDTAQEIDVGVLNFTTPEGETAERIFLNEASLGLSGRVCQYVNGSRKRLGGGVTYFVAALRALQTYRPAHVRIAVDGQDLGEFPLGTVLIANGQYAGGGMRFAPAAILDDGMLDVTVLHRGTTLQMIRLAPRLYQGNIHLAKGVSCFRGIHVAVTEVTRGTLVVEADGEPIGTTPIEATVLGGALRMIGVRQDVLRTP
ncbi:MAG: diacylglycerol kinase family lipid kinase [Deltaproteobacteria bacterium]|nr:diacylglycerol kinase family lipid kinase [Deltaproteobacteria bacterium]MBW2253937.1 diacylglycerol kinase family lipid kinase [Deltaproteobacteria bacterium]